MSIARAYASASETPLDTIEIIHSGLTNGVQRFISGYRDITATLETGATVTFTAIGSNLKLPDRSTEGQQSIQFGFDNTSRLPSDQIKQVVNASRESKEVPILNYRPYLPSSLTAPADGPYIFQVKSSQMDRNQVVITASFFQIGNMAWPFRKYDPDKYPGVRYA